MVAPSNVHVAFVGQKEEKANDDDRDAERATIHHVTVDHINLLAFARPPRRPVAGENPEDIVELTVGIPDDNYSPTVRNSDFVEGRSEHLSVFFGDGLEQ